MGRRSAHVIDITICAVLFLGIWFTRAASASAFVTWDEPAWVYRSVRFLLALERGDLRGRVDVERFADFFQGGDELGMPDAVAHAQARQAVDFGKGAHQQQVRRLAVPDERQQVRRLVQVFEVGFVHHEQDFRRHLMDEPQQIGGRRQRPRGIVRVGHKDHARAGGNGAGHRGQVVTVVPGGHHDQPPPKKQGDDWIDHEGVLRDDRLHSRRDERVADEFEDFVGPVAQDEVRGRHAQLLRQALLQIKSVAIGVKVQVPERLLQRREGQGRGA